MSNNYFNVFLPQEVDAFGNNIQKKNTKAMLKIEKKMCILYIYWEYLISILSLKLFPATKNIFQNKNYHLSTVVLHVLGKQAIKVMSNTLTSLSRRKRLDRLYT